ncbi:RNA-directed DNA polymerase, eukaryota [Tanacetum coccineum]
MVFSSSKLDSLPSHRGYGSPNRFFLWFFADEDCCSMLYRCWIRGVMGVADGVLWVTMGSGHLLMAFPYAHFLWCCDKGFLWWLVMVSYGGFLMGVSDGVSVGVSDGLFLCGIVWLIGVADAVFLIRVPDDVLLSDAGLLMPLVASEKMINSEDDGAGGDESTVSLDKLPTRLNLSLRGLDIPSIICPLCSIAVESISHLLFSCQLARQLMIKVVHWWESEYQDFQSYEDWLLWFKNLRVFKRLKDVFEGVCYISWAYALESCKNIDVASKLSQNSLAFTFRREPRGGVEQDQFDSLKAMVEGDFTVASIRKLIDEFTLSEVSSSTRWIKAVPIKVNVLAWKIKLDNLPTRLNISRRGMDIDSILCPTCGKAVESTRHIFFTCQIARDILHLITSWWNIPYMEVSSYEEWLNVLMKLQEALDEEAILEEQILSLMHRFADRFTDRRVEINNLMVLHDHQLIDYGKYALGCMTGADMKKCVYLKSVRDELLRSMEEKRQLMTNYRDM